MIDRLIELSARHRFLVLGFAAVAAVGGWRAMTRLPLDALPDLGDKQVIVHADWDRSPDLIDAQVTSPLVSALLSTPRVKTVRGLSDYGAANVYVIFEDDVALDWARSRTLEALSTVASRMPDGVTPRLGPDATAVGWVFQYALVDPSGAHDLRALRAYQDWTLKDALRSVPGVAEVATVGGFVREIHVDVDPNRLRAFGVSIQRVAAVLAEGNRDAGGRVVESGGHELIVRGLGSARNATDIERLLVGTANDGSPIRVMDVARVAIGSDLRRGAADLDGTGETVSGIVVMRQGGNALDVVDRVKAKISDLAPFLPTGVRIVPVYDRSELVHRAIGTLTTTILEVMAIVAAVIVLFLWHAPSTAVPLVTLPLAVLIAFIPLSALGVGANVMSLAGIAIAIGALVDAAIVVVEQSHKRLEEWDRGGRVGDPRAVVLAGIKEVGRPSFFALLVIAISFLPVLALTGEAGRLFAPLALAKSVAMAVAAILAVTVDPALRLALTRRELIGTIRQERDHPLTRRIMAAYEPAVAWTLAHKRAVFSAAAIAVAAAIPVWLALGTELAPSLDEGTLLYMPSIMPGISMTEASRLLQATDRTLRAFPEVASVLGKAGRADTATDPAPISMFETLIVLRPRREWPERLSRDELIVKLDAALTLPGLSNSWSMPVRGRVDMLATGVKTPVGLKIAGRGIDEIEKAGAQAAAVLRSVRGTRGVFAEQLGRAVYLDVRWDRDALARAGIMLDDAQAAVRYAIGGESVTTIYDGREKTAVRVRFPRDPRDDAGSLGRILVSTADGGKHVPIAQLATLATTSAPAMIRNEDGRMTGYVYVDVATSDLAGYLAEADRALKRATWPSGCTFAWTGRYEEIARMQAQLAFIVPLTLAAIVFLIYASTRSWTKTGIVLLAVPFSAVGAVGFLYVLGYHVSAAVWVGLIALLAVDAETGVFMLLYLDQAYERARSAGTLRGPADLTHAVIEGAARRVRPKLMTAATMFFGLLPVLWSTGTGSEVMKRIAAPMIGGIVTSFALELLVYPAIFHSWKERSLPGSLTSG